MAKKSSLDSNNMLAFDLNDDDDHLAYIDAIYADHKKAQVRKSRKNTNQTGSAPKSRSSKDS